MQTYTVPKTLSTIEYGSDFNTVRNGLIDIDKNINGIWKPTGEPIMVKSLYRDTVRTLSSVDLGRPWLDEKNPNKTTEFQSYDGFRNVPIAGYIYRPMGEDILVIPHNGWMGFYTECLMTLVRDENGIWVQHYGLPLGQKQYANAYGIDCENISPANDNMVAMRGLYGKVAPQLYEKVKNNFDDVQQKTNAYYKPLNDWWKKSQGK